MFNHLAQGVHGLVGILVGAAFLKGTRFRLFARGEVACPANRDTLICDIIGNARGEGGFRLRRGQRKGNQGRGARKRENGDDASNHITPLCIAAESPSAGPANQFMVRQYQYQSTATNAITL